MMSRQSGRMDCKCPDYFFNYYYLHLLYFILLLLYYYNVLLFYYYSITIYECFVIYKGYCL